MKNVVIAGAGARGNRVFADLIASHDTGFRVHAVVEPNDGRRESFQARYGVPDERAFRSIVDLLERPRLADIVFICTPDVTHYSHARAASEKGYDVLLEKPIATNLPECLSLLDVQQTHGNRIFVAHVLRYSPFFRAIRDVIRSRRYGEVRHVELSENVAHWHFAHSYVRGNWNREELSGPVVLTKSSHDLDILDWLMGDDRAMAVTSWGDLSYFRRENAPAEAADRCVDCPLKDECTYSATRFYLNDYDEWPFNVIAQPPDRVEERLEALRTGPYGRCVWKHDNDVCDRQTVVVEFESGVRAVFGLYAHTATNTRRIRILFDDAELEGDLRENRIIVSHFDGLKVEPRSETIPIREIEDPHGHGGGDLELLSRLHDHLTANQHGDIVTSLESSITSHVLAFLAEDSRHNQNVTMPVPPIFPPQAIRMPHPPRILESGDEQWATSDER